jgi:glycosyltransferase involved in cell wall biosynthesis
MLGATVHHAGRGAIRLRSIRSIVQEHRRGRFDLLHAFWLVPAGVVAAVAGALIRRPVLAHVAGGELVDLPDLGYGHASYRAGRMWTRLALARADRITAASAPMVEAIRRLGFAADRVPLGVDLERWPVAAPRRRPANRPARLVHVASLNLVKDQTTLVTAASRLAAGGCDFTLDIAGADTLGGRIPALAERLGIAGRVRFHGYLSHDRLHPLVQSADLLWVSSRHEAGPLVVLEAAVAGVPTVGTAVGHLREWTPDAAVAVAVGDADALARETRALLENEERRLSLAREAQRRALAEDAESTAARFQELYDVVLSGATRRGRGR